METDPFYEEEEAPDSELPTLGHPLTCCVPEGAEGRLDRWLAAAYPDFSRARIQALIKEGHVTCNDLPVKADMKPVPGQVIAIHVPPPVSPIPAAEDIPLDVLYEDAHCLVLNKPPGLVVHPAPGHATGTLVNALIHHCKDLQGVGGVERPGIVHRLDKETSGLMMVAKSDAAMAGFIRSFQSGAIGKIYLALVHGVPKKHEGQVRTLIGRHPVHRKKMAVVVRNGKMAITHYVVERQLAHAVCLVRCRIETGRTHQIRVHMMSLGCPVVGDSLYGRSALDKKLPVLPPRQMLHAACLRFPHPITGIPMTFDVPPPSDFAHLLEKL